jgi:hypothetical protein
MISNARLYLLTILITHKQNNIEIIDLYVAANFYILFDHLMFFENSIFLTH